MARYRVLVGFCRGVADDAEVGQEIDGASLSPWLLRLKVDSGSLELLPDAAEQAAPGEGAATHATAPAADSAASAKPTAPAKPGKKEN